MLAFDFNYRASPETDLAFLVPADGHVFAVIGSAAQFEYLSRETPVAEDVSDEDEGDDLDFDML
jgi:hypothetical protein